jgi:hypothetical protein
VKERDLQDVKVGDMIAAMSHNIGRVDRWTGAIHEVKKVTAKQFMVIGRWFEKATGRERRRSMSQYHYELATPDQIEANRKRAAARTVEDAKRGSFYARPEQKDVSAIFRLLSDMTPDNHPLDRLTPAEWAALRRRLGALDSGDWSWQCNECGSNEFSSSVSEHDLESLSCTNCGGNEFHKVKA